MFSPTLYIDAKVIREITPQIDFNNDGIKLELSLYNEGKYDCDQLRTVVRNVGVRLGITNNLNKPLIINNIYLGIIINGKSNYHYSSSLVSKFPINLESEEKFCVNFYGYDIRKKFAQHENEKGVFILYLSNGNQIESSEFDGDRIEDYITDLEDGENPNWGSKDYYSLDKEIAQILT